MAILIIFLLSTIQNFVSLSLHYKQKTTKKYLNVFAEYLKGQFNGMNLKQRMKIEIQQITIDIFSNQTISQLLDCFDLS